jgi:hypothetical protein
MTHSAILFYVVVHAALILCALAWVIDRMKRRLKRYVVAAADPGRGAALGCAYHHNLVRDPEKEPERRIQRLA